MRRADPRLRRGLGSVNLAGGQTMSPRTAAKGRPLLSSPLAREIVAVLVFKAAFLTALYFAFFSGAAPGPVIPAFPSAPEQGTQAP